MRHVFGRAGIAAVLAALVVISIVQSSASARPAAAATVAEAAQPALAAAATWTGTWSASPQSVSPTFRQQTLRQIAHTSIGGTAARVQLSNAYSTQPVTLSDVHIARRTSGSSIDTTTDRTATFGGSTSVTIPAGGTAVSDSIAFAVAALSDVAVSFYFPQQTGALTGHQLGNQTNYIAAGDVSGNGSLTGVQSTGSYFVLANLDVTNAAATGAVVVIGASITDGVGTPSDSNRRWPNDLAVRLNNSGRTVGVLNQGISGNRLLVDGSGQSELHRFARDAVNQPGVRWVISAESIGNDVGATNPPTADQLITATKQVMAQAHQAGLSFVCITLPPFQGAARWTQQGENTRLAINAFVRGAGSGCDGIVDVEAATLDPANPTRLLPSFDSGDHLHPNAAGQQAMADAVNLNLFATAQTTTVISLRARANGKFVTAGTAPLIADATAIGAAQQFDQLDAGAGNIALRAHANNQIVCTNQTGTQSLIANCAAITVPGTFQLIHNSDGTVTLKAVVNNQYVTAEGGGAQPLIANRAAIGGWERFDLTTS